MQLKLKDNSIVTIEDRYISYSPFLTVLTSTSNTVDKIDDAYVLDVEPGEFGEYVKYISGRSFYMDEKVAILFNFMGHNNDLKYEPAVWGMKLRDNWIRDNFYRLELWRDPYYGLIEVPIVNKISYILKPGFFIAGGAALWMAGLIPKLADVDVFTTLSEEDANRELASIDSIKITVNGYTITHYEKGYRIQHILRLYQSPSEIVHGFDLDCVGILYDGEKLWVTDRCLASIREKMNWYDPTRSSPSYVYRLLKYKRRGFNIHLPLFSPDSIDVDAVLELAHRHVGLELDEMNYIRSRIYDIEDLMIVTEQERFRTKASILKYKDLMKEDMSIIGREVMTKRHSNVSYRHVDQATQLIMGAYLGFYPSEILRCSDYSTKSNQGWRCPGKRRKFHIDPSKIRWKRQDPMEQVTSTFTPMPVSDLEAWYESSIIYKKDIIPVGTRD